MQRTVSGRNELMRINAGAGATRETEIIYMSLQYSPEPGTTQR